MVEAETYTIHLTAFIYQPVATPHQPRYARQLPPGGSQVVQTFSLYALLQGVL